MNLCKRAWAIGSVALLCLAVGFSEAPLAGAEKGHGAGKDPGAEEIDHLSLAARMIHDEHYDRALTVLAEVDLDAPELDWARFHTLRGLAHLKQSSHEQARAEFETAIDKGQKDPAIHLFRAQACHALDDFECVLRALDQAGADARSKPGTHVMRAMAQWKLGRREAAIDTLMAGGKRFPEVAEFQRLQIFYLIDMGLYLAAVDVSERYVARKDMQAQDYVAIAEALRSAKAYARAQLLMEGARLRFPENDKVLVQLAHSYLDAGRPIPAAMLFEEAARIEPKYTLEAAELYKQAGMQHRAEWLNARVVDQKAKAKQRLSLLVEAQEFESVTAMLPKLSRLSLIGDESIRYAVAYAFYKTGQFDAAEEHLRQIQDPQLFESALQLRRAIAACQESGWQCTP